MDMKKLGIIAGIIIIIVIVIGTVIFLGQTFNTPASITQGSESDSYELQINSSGKWRLDLTVDGKYSSDEGVGSKTIDLGKNVKYASITVNQYKNGPTDVYLLKNNEVVKNKSSTSENVETIYFDYRI